jgi:hypothetical protein
MTRVLWISLLCSLFAVLPSYAQTDALPLTQTFVAQTSEPLIFNYPEGWYVLESPEFIVIADSQQTYEQFRSNPQAPIPPNMVAITVIRPQALTIAFGLPADATLETLVTVVQTQLPQAPTSLEGIALGTYPAIRFAYTPGRFEAVSFAFDSGALYYAAVSVAPGTLAAIEPTVRALFASFIVLDEEERQLEDITIDSTLVTETYSVQLAPFTLNYPGGWTISESEFGAIQLANVATAGNVFEPPVPDVVRVQVTFTRADELIIPIEDPDARHVLQLTMAADMAVLPLETPYYDISEFRVGGYAAARTAALGAQSERLLLVVNLEGWFATIRATAYAQQLALFEPIILALAGSFVSLEIPEATTEATTAP